jgi:hypothetical protein
VRPASRAARWLAGLLPLAAIVVWLGLAGATCGPWGRTPGLMLFGEPVAEGVRDWSFVEPHSEIAVETRPPWLLPHSVTTSWLLVDGALFIPARDAAGKRWVRNALQRPDVRIRIGDRLYSTRLAPVEDPDERQRLLDAAFHKWPQFRRRGVDGDAMAFFRVESPSAE